MMDSFSFYKAMWPSNFHYTKFVKNECRSAGETRSGWTRGQEISFLLNAPSFLVRGEDQAGYWREAFEEDLGDLRAPGLEDADGAEFALQVKGDSMDERFPEGSILYCRRYNEEDEEKPVGKYIIVMRKDRRTDLTEATCKRLGMNGDTYVLIPESSNGDHEESFLKPLNDAYEVWIHAVVVGATVRFG